MTDRTDRTPSAPVPAVPRPARAALRAVHLGAEALVDRLDAGTADEQNVRTTFEVLHRLLTNAERAILGTAPSPAVEAHPTPLPAPERTHGPPTTPAAIAPAGEVTLRVWLDATVSDEDGGPGWMWCVTVDGWSEFGAAEDPGACFAEAVGVAVGWR